METKMGVLRNNKIDSFLTIRDEPTIDWLRNYTDYSPTDTSKIEPHRIYSNEILKLLVFWNNMGYTCIQQLEKLINLHANIFRDCIVVWDE